MWDVTAEVGTKKQGEGDSKWAELEEEA